MTIQTPDTRGPWDQRKAEAAAAGLAVVAILEAAGDGTATLAIPLLVTRTALVAASRRAQASATGLANVSGRFPHGGAGLVTLDEGQISYVVRTHEAADHEGKLHPYCNGINSDADVAGVRAGLERRHAIEIDILEKKVRRRDRTLRKLRKELKALKQG